MRALIFAHGDLPSRALVESLRAGASLLVAADGGANRALDYGITVDVAIGDLDSVSAAVRAALPASAFHLDADPDRTDLQKAIDFCLEHGATEIDIVAAGGGRADHALANLSVLPLYRGRARLTIHDDLFATSLVDGVATITAPLGTVVSLIAIGECTGVTTSGLRWDLLSAILPFSPLGIHNEVVTSPATVSVESGDLLLFEGRWVEKHG